MVGVRLDGRVGGGVEGVEWDGWAAGCTGPHVKLLSRRVLASQWPGSKCFFAPCTSLATPANSLAVRHRELEGGARLPQVPHHQPPVRRRRHQRVVVHLQDKGS